MQNVVFSILLSLSFITQPNFNSCSDFYENHPVKSDIMLQIVLKSYGYYEGKIDGKFGNSSKKHLYFFKVIIISHLTVFWVNKHVNYC